MYKEFSYRPEVINHLEAYVKTCKEPDAPFMILGERSWSLPDVIAEIKEKTQLGRSFYSVWESLYDKDITQKRNRRI